MQRVWSILIVLALALGSPAVAMGWTRCFCGPAFPIVPAQPKADACCVLAGASNAPSGAPAISSAHEPCDCGCGARSSHEESRRIDRAVASGAASQPVADVLPVRLTGWTALARVWSPRPESQGPPLALGRSIAEFTSVRLT